ncbi:hypothetical protein PI124_g1576 [Phytophthora idaei]|nr:hypothetical protein PI124_g1576 [Phytophthora idaei]
MDLKNIVVFVLGLAVLQMLNPVMSRVVTQFMKRFRRYHLRHSIDKSESNKNSMFDEKKKMR